MTKIKIRSNPYNREISYLTMDEATGQWVDVRETDERSRLRETDSERSFLPFKIKEIITIIIKEYYVGREKVQLYFEGTQDEYYEVEAVCESDDVKDKIELIRTNTILENARFIKGDIKEVFERVNPVIENIMKEDFSVKRGLNKVSQALDDVIPLCVFGNYSAGKSTFINALIGVELLPSGGDPVTAKIYEIRNSEFFDQAKISFEFHGERIEISIEGKEFRVLKGDSETDIVKSIKEEIDNEGSHELYAMVRIAMDILNNYEKKDKEVTEIGSVITLVVPFSTSGVIGNSSNKFVIFDTPGSNSNSNQDHAKVLAEAMDGFSNGIPLWVTQYDAHDTKDNAELCDKVLAIDSLDKRFTMIIFNKADDADLPEGGFSEKQVKEILEYRAIEKMYASGIFFVSSIMGLGGKNDGEFVDRFYRKTFRTQSLTFSDPEDIDYMSLYKYNIMPAQVKQNALDYCQKNENLIYVNSGLYCIEKEIENFASKHSSYNKCQMVLAFLSNVIDKTNARIDERTKVLKDANNVAHSYLALTLGEDSYMSKSAINTWRGNVEDEAGQAKEITEYIKMLRHPLFGLNPGVVGKVEDDEVKVEVDEDTEFIVYPPIVTATTSLSGKELAYSLNFPQKSIAGLPVLECVEFGRNVVTYDEVRQDAPEIGLGNVFHMNHTENTKVSLSKKSLASHTFITGSTGSGKSNTVYHMLDRARKQGVKFLVVEPAKGEYKNVFGGRKDVTVLGTNPKLSQLLRINPFSFPENIHVLEHMDRLVEIFNVCWPMYAAMPAVLKNAVEKSYVDCGWDIVKSENKYGEELYPSFADVARNVKEIIDSSEYDAENKGAYKGSLLTRLQSLCNGINGMIFVADEIPKEQLFEENVIVDLSRVGSSETKSLIMGMMVLKLQEYRMSSATGMNAELNHITVLEEAHNLLRRTSNEQSAEGSNLLGKSVEMLSNAIAEMRTYGEGFIIADQAPGLMDMSVIRNTNTKIILRLPDQADRELVGRAANLNEDQITELAKLPCGVAAVYQNEWIQPVLCKVDLFAAPEKPFMFDPDDNDLDNYCKTEVEESLLNCIMEKEILRRGNKTDLKALKSKIIKSKLETCVKRDFMEYLEHDGENAIETLRKLIYDFLSAENAIIEAKQCNDIVEWTRTVVDRLNPSLRAYPNKQIDLALALILYEQTLRDASYGSVFCKFTEVYKNEGGVF